MWTALFGQISTQSEMARRVGNNLNQTRNREKAQRREGKVLSVISSWKIFDHANCIQNSLYCLILFSLFCVELKSSYRTNRFCSSLPSIFSHKQKHTDAPNPSTRITNIFLCFSLVQGSGFFSHILWNFDFISLFVLLCIATEQRFAACSQDISSLLLQYSVQAKYTTTTFTRPYSAYSTISVSDEHNGSYTLICNHATIFCWSCIHCLRRCSSIYSPHYGNKSIVDEIPIWKNHFILCVCVDFFFCIAFSFTSLIL